MVSLDICRGLSDTIKCGLSESAKHIQLLRLEVGVRFDFLDLVAPESGIL